MDAFDMTKHNMFTVMRDMINGTIIHDLGIIKEVLEDGYVDVITIQKYMGVPKRMACKYLGVRSANISIGIKPEVEDIVLILTLAHAQSDYFESPECIEATYPTGYNERSAVCVPIGVFNEELESKVKIQVTDELLSIQSEIPFEALFNDVVIQASKDGVDVATKDSSIKMTDSEVKLICKDAFIEMSSGGTVKINGNLEVSK